MRYSELTHYPAPRKGSRNPPLQLANHVVGIARRSSVLLSFYLNENADGIGINFYSP